jgi:hypothetical protein
MAYTPPTIGPFGLLISLYNDYLAYLNAQYLAIYGTSVYLGPESPDEQWNSTLALIAFDSTNALQQIYNSWNPLTAVGAALDMIGILIGTARKVASYSTALVTVSGTAGAIISGGVVHELPADMRKALTADPRALAAWESLTPLARNEWICWTTIVKKAETRQEHVERTVSQLKEGDRRPCCWPGCPHR